VFLTHFESLTLVSFLSLGVSVGLVLVRAWVLVCFGFEFGSLLSSQVFGEGNGWICWPNK
jgi:hypothetical protein